MAEWPAYNREVETIQPAFEVRARDTIDSVTRRIYRIDIAGKNLRDSGDGCMPEFSGDGKRLVFTFPGFGVGTMDLDGKNRDYFERYGWAGQWSRDGKCICRGRGGNITVLNLEVERPVADTEEIE